MATNEIDKMIREKRVYFVGERLPADWYEAFRMWLPLAEAGDAKAQYNIGRCYNNGDGVDEDKNQALEWYLKAAAQGDPRAHFNLYLIYEKKGDTEKASLYLGKAAELNEPRALNQTANIAFVDGDKDKARAIYKTLADNGDAKAQMGLAACDMEVSFSEKLFTHYYSYNGSGGGTVSNSYKTHGIVIRMKNNSQFSARGMVFLQKYERQLVLIDPLQAGVHDQKHEDKPTKKIGEPIKLASSCLAPGQFVELEHDFSTIKESTCVLYTSMEVESCEDNKIWQAYRVKGEPVIWEWEPPKKSGCFVLTACYEDYDAPTVFAFRQFRDQHLQKYWLGQKFIAWYYCQGPKMAAFISNKPKTKSALRAVFNRLVKILPS